MVVLGYRITGMAKMGVLHSMGMAIGTDDKRGRA
jgi:hypothetical protein